MSKRIDTVIFDIGGVLTVYEEKSFFRLLGFSEEMTERLYLATMKSGYWDECDIGNLSLQEIVALFQTKDPEIAEEIASCFTDVSLLVRKSESAIPWIRKVKESGRKVLVLSNFSSFAKEQCAKALDFLSEVDGGILSFEHRIIKPMPEIYEKLIAMYDLDPEACVFIDDTVKNLDAAEKFGIHTIRYRNQEQAEKELDELLEI